MVKKKMIGEASKINDLDLTVENGSESAINEVALNSEQILSPEIKFPVVGIGASAGGLAAFEAFFSGMPVDIEPGMAFVLVQHLAPDHKSILADLIRRYTRMQVFEVEDGVRVQPNCAYIIPPNHDMAFVNGTLQLLDPSEPRGQRLPIDFFFRSLAQDQHERAIGIVLSGTGSDGTLGVRAIKGEAGMIMAQNPESTEFDGMPRSAIATGMVDYELPPAEMATQLIAYAAHAYGTLASLTTKSTPKSENSLLKIFVLLRNQTGHDFSLYKPSTINRRVERRMAVHQINTFESYVKYLQQNSSEVDALFHDLLIGVTNFFRDPEAFRTLEEQAIPNLFASKPSGSVIRIWSTGCSTGEEAYSIAILMVEYMEKLRRNYTIQIFATDIDSRAISAARSGRYPTSITADLTPARLARFFTMEPGGGGYRIHKTIRDMLVFSEQDVVKDPPFSKLDLISCRNLMIYLGARLQKKLIPLFHYALNPDGMLFLGASEGIGDYDNLFIPLDHKWKLYRRKEEYQGAQRLALSRFLPPMSAIEAALPRLTDNNETRFGHQHRVPLRELTEKALLEQIAPVAALVNEQGDILYLHGRSGMYLEMSEGVTTINNILKMAREGLRMGLTTTLHKAKSTKGIVHAPGLRVKTNSHFTRVNLSIRPLTTSASPDSTLYLVVLEEAAPEPVPSNPSSESRDLSVDLNARIKVLQEELRTKDEYLQSTHEELETSNEELKSSNEEMQSVNEELQSTNEELETAKEELQSVNEELVTINFELSSKVTELSRINNDMNNLLAGSGIATVFVDHQLRILRFTPVARTIINLIQSDVGRPVAHIVSNLRGYDSLVQDVETVLANLIPKEMEVQITTGAWYTMRIQPYRTLDNVIEGAVITFAEITQMKKTQETLRKNEEFLDNLLENAPVSIYAIGADGTILLVNQKWKADTGTKNEQVVGRTLAQIFKAETANMFLSDNQKVLESGRVLSKEEEAEAPVNVHQFYTVKFPLHNIHGQPEAVGGISMDVTERKLAEEALRKAYDKLRLAVVVHDAHDAITVENLEGRIIAWNPAAERMYGWSESEALLMNVRDRIPEGLRESVKSETLLLSRAKILEPYRTQRITKDGSTVEIWMTATALVNDLGQMYAISTTERAKDDSD
jgi:two-component system CheB/CheR fusion protein